MASMTCIRRQSQMPTYPECIAGNTYNFPLAYAMRPDRGIALGNITTTTDHEHQATWKAESQRWFSFVSCAYENPPEQGPAFPLLLIGRFNSPENFAFEKGSSYGMPRSNLRSMRSVEMLRQG